MGKQLELFKPDLMSMETASIDTRKVIDHCVLSDKELEEQINREFANCMKPTGIGIVTAYINSKWHDIHYWVKCHFKYPYQRVKRGYADNDVWGLDSYLTDVIIGSVTQLRNNPCGHPCDFDSVEEWQAELDKIIKAFQDYKNYSDDSQARLEVAYKLYNIPRWKDVATGDLEKFNDYLNNPKYKLPRDVYEKFWDDERVIYNNIKKRMKKLIDVWGNLWD